jgi:hypothetical protein
MTRLKQHLKRLRVIQERRQACKASFQASSQASMVIKDRLERIKHEAKAKQGGDWVGS